MGSGCTPPAKDTEANNDAETIGTAKAALTTSPINTVWHDNSASGCVCTGISSGGYTYVASGGYSPRSKPFSESLPAEARVTGIQVITQGTACYSPSVAVTIDGIAIGTLSPGNSCSCGACDTNTVSLVNAAGIPGFVVGAAHTLTFAVSATNTYFYPSSVDVVITYDYGATTTTLASTTNPSVFGQSLTFTAHVTASATTPTGTVSFVEGATTLGTGTLNGAGDATFTTSALSVGPHDVQANFAGGDSFGSSASSTLTQTVNKASTATTLASSSNPSIVGGSTTLTATVSPTGPGAGTTSGTVTFLEGTTVLGTATVGAGGAATLDLSSLGVGAHDITAAYGGDGSFQTSTSTAVTQTVAQDGTTTSLASDLNPSTFGATVNLTASVSSNGTGGTPTGTVTFSEGTTVLGTATLNGSAAGTLSIATLAGGAHTISATYSGDTNHQAGAAATVNQVVNGAISTTALATSKSPSKFGESVTLTATVSSAVSGTVGGTVTFKEGTTVLGTATLGAGGVATLTTSTLGTASHDIVAIYSGSPNYATSTSASLAQVVSAASTTTTLVASNNPAAVGAPVSFTATVAPVAPGAGTPSGSVTFKEGTTVLGTGTLTGGVATFTTSTLPIGTHEIIANYPASTNFGASASATLTESIAALATTATLVSAPNPSKVKATVLLTATLTGDGGIPGGDVTFRDTTGADGGTTLGSAGLDGGVATLSVTTLDVGTHALSAQYTGDTAFGATVAAVSHVVTKVPTTTAISSTPNPARSGEEVSLTASVTSELSGATGNVDFFDGTTKLGTTALSATTAKATLKVSTLPSGGHVISAVYSGDTLHDGSTSSSVTQNVDQDAGANTVTDAGSTPDASAPDASVDAGTSPQVDAVDTGSGCGCSTVPVNDVSLAIVPSIALVVGLGLRRRARKQNDDVDG